jgi:hypothetical protein
MPVPTRYNQGVSTHKLGHPLQDYPLPDPIQTGSSPLSNVFSYVQDYTDYGSTANFTITGTLTTWALEAGVGGFAVLTPGGATTASVMYRNAPTFQFVSGNKFWFVQRIIPGLFATTGTYAFGLQFGAATTDGIWFTKPASSTSINLVSTVASTATILVTGVSTHTAGTLAAGATTALSNIVTVTSTANLVVGQYVYGTGIPLNATVTAVTSATTFTISAPATATGSALTIIYATALDVAFYYNGVDLFVYNNDLLVARITAPTIGAANTFTLTNQPLTQFVSCTPTATDLIHQDYVTVAQEITR